MRPTYIAGAVLLAVASFEAGRWHSEPASASSTGSERRILYYRDPMHPAYTSPKAGVAPDCGMQLIPVYAAELRTAPVSAGSVSISPEAQKLAGVRTMEVRRLSSVQHIRMPGRVAADEGRVYKVAPKVEGWVRQIFPVTTGTHVRKGQPLVSMYGRDYRMAQQSYIYALKAWDQVVKDKDPTKDFADSTAQVKLQVTEALTNLENMWADPEQIRTIARTREVEFETRVTAPADGFVVARNVFVNQKFDAGAELYRIVDLSRVWIVADVFAGDDQRIPSGAPARVKVSSSPNTVLQARVGSILPQFDASSRTLKLRLEADNPQFTLRPDMLVDVEIDVTMPSAIVVPADAVIDAGRTQTVYADTGDGSFEPRMVETGWRHGGDVEILRGLRQGERIVTSATFLVDSESRLR